MKKFLCLTLIAVMCSVIFCSCEKGNDIANGNPLIGTWEGLMAEVMEVSFTFNEDMTCDFTAMGIKLVSGTYSYDKKNLTLTMPPALDPKAPIENYTKPYNIKGETLSYHYNKYDLTLIKVEIE